MRRRRGHADTDSMELLLDTVCNVFGGVVFIAMLLALLAKPLVVESDGGQEGVVEVVPEDQPQRDLAGLRHEAERLERAAAEFRLVREAVGDEDTERAADVMNTIRDRQADAEAQVEEAEKWLARFREVVEEPEAELTQRIREAEAVVLARERAVELTRQTQQLSHRLPIERRTRKTQVMVLLTSGRLYCLPIGSGEHLTRAFDDVTVTVIGFGTHKVSPRPGAGEPIAADPIEMARTAALLRNMSPERHFWDCFVASDSVTEFRRLHAALAARGYSFRVTPLADASEVYFGPASFLTAQ